jgi:transposase InsO family protein
MLGDEVHDRICETRRRTGWGPRQIASELGLPHASVHRALRRRRMSRRPRAPKEAVVRYEWPCPGNLLHMDTKRFVRFTQPGHALTGDRTKRSRQAGWEVVHTLEDDHSRVCYSEVHDDERAETVAKFTRRGLDWFLELGVVAERILTDNHFSYTRGRVLRELLEARAIEHWTIEAYRPQTNGKVERFYQTLAREWAYGQRYRNSAARRAALPHWLDYYNTRRRHSGIGDRTPISRVHNVLGQDT